MFQASCWAANACAIVGADAFRLGRADVRCSQRAWGAVIPRLLFGTLLVVLAMLQATLFPVLSPLGITPNLVLVAILLWSATRDPREGLLWAFSIGMFLSLLTLTPLGIDALGLAPVVVVGWFSYSRFFRSGPVFPVLMAVVASLASDLVLALAAPLYGGIISLTGALRVGLVGALLNTLAVPPLFGIIYLLDTWIERNASYARA